METTGKPAAWLAIIEQRCPRCRAGRIFRGSIFRGFPQMYERCEICNLKFEREPGYFLGAMYIGYGLGIMAIVTHRRDSVERHFLVHRERHRLGLRPVSAPQAFL